MTSPVNMPRSRCCGRRGGAAIIVLASGALYIAMKGRLAWYGLMQWALSDTLRPVGKVVLAIDRAAYILAFLLGAVGWAYISSRRVSPWVGLGYCGCRGDGASAPRGAASRLDVLDPPAVDCHRGGVRRCSPHHDRQDAAQHAARLVAAVQLGAHVSLRRGSKSRSGRMQCACTTSLNEGPRAAAPRRCCADGAREGRIIGLEWTHL